MPTSYRVEIEPGVRVTAIEYAASGAAVPATFILAHGAGANQRSPFIVRFATGLAARGLDVVTFNFPYMEEGRRLPDPGPRLEACYRAVIGAAQARQWNGLRGLFIGGKSLGGRIASQVAAGSDPIPHLAGLIFLGYPLHPPGQADKRRDKHLGRITVPMLFVQGAKDAFGTPAELQTVLAHLKVRTTLEIVSGGDHSLTVPKKWPVTQEEVHAAAQDQIVRWVKDVLA